MAPANPEAEGLWGDGIGGLRAASEVRVDFVEVAVSEVVVDSAARPRPTIGRNDPSVQRWMMTSPGPTSDLHSANDTSCSFPPLQTTDVSRCRRTY